VRNQEKDMLNQASVKPRLILGYIRGCACMGESACHGVGERRMTPLIGFIR